MNYTEILNWIDNLITPDKWYNVTKILQQSALMNLMDWDEIPDCEFNDNKTKFRKCSLPGLDFKKQLFPDYEKSKQKLKSHFEKNPLILIKETPDLAKQMGFE